MMREVDYYIAEDSKSKTETLTATLTETHSTTEMIETSCPLYIHDEFANEETDPIISISSQL